MDSEVLRVVVGIVLFFGLAIAGVRGVPFVGFAMAALAVALGFEAIRALDYAEPLHEWQCDEACGEGPGQEGWQFTPDAWQWSGLWIAAVVGTIAVWLSAGIAVAAGAVGLRSLASRGVARRIYLLAALAMAVGTLSFGAFTIIVAPLGDRYGI
jgi:hypothetical protein